MHHQLAQLQRIQPMPSVANFLLIRFCKCLVPLREAPGATSPCPAEKLLLFAGLGANWLRIGFQSRCGKRPIVSALRQEWAQSTRL